MAFMICDEADVSASVEIIGCHGTVEAEEIPSTVSDDRLRVDNGVGLGD